MKRVTIAVCLLVLTAGCIVQTGDSNSTTATPSLADRVDRNAKTPAEPTTPSAVTYEVDVERIEDAFHRKINQQRISQGTEPLKRSEKLDRIARYKSWDMAHRDYVAHSGPNGTTHSMMRQKFNSSCTKYGQNIHFRKNFGDPESAKPHLDNVSGATSLAVKSLMNSSGHRQNILDPDYEVQGIGVFVDENGTLYLTQEFCG